MSLKGGWWPAPRRILIISDLWVWGGPVRALQWRPRHQHRRLMAEQAREVNESEVAAGDVHPSHRQILKPS